MLDGFPMTKRQADLMAACHIIPIRVIELQLDKDEMLRRGMKDKMEANRSESLTESQCSRLYGAVCGVQYVESMYNKYFDFHWCKGDCIQ